ncbi:type II secretion system protein [Actimicrobium sp. CCC2.4]|uniref:PulJ/GspJ family protein n=1 Tax=Actimicrobium sp. CCC2.4 TaxID=3048606 RepID=UPI002AC8B704|nr:type II secretion system protein [Actimicrobium sp. CCC2.4]MEB0134702.1 type II secretion system protein [Actimicrobium sp. CCC2.4]WPX30645.1 type II secretion system protein [Actimicrobium sp. CCC2.4]
MKPFNFQRHQYGFTLIEAVMVLTITAIVAGVVAIFLRTPVQSYFDVSRRVTVTDTLDTALQRIGRDVRLALPNSVRVSADGQSLEFLHTRAGGRYRSETDRAGNGDVLDFNNVDLSFDVLGAPLEMTSGDQIVVYNLGVPGADAYETTISALPHVRKAYTGPSGLVSHITLATDTRFPFDSPGHRFQVVDTAVTYRCRDGVLMRYWGYGIQPAQPDPPTDGQSALLATQVSACYFGYAPGVTERSGLVTLQLALTSQDETTRLAYQVHVSNAP